MILSRRSFLKTSGTLAAGALMPALVACASSAPRANAPKAVVVGGGYGGATAAKYLRLWSAGEIDVTLIEADDAFVSCPLSNLVIGGSKRLTDITVEYAGLEMYGVRRIRGFAEAIDPAARKIVLRGGERLAYDRLIVSPGVDFLYDTIPALNSPDAQARVLHAWKAGSQTEALRRQLVAMRDGGVFVIHIPRAPFRCPPGPYERACQVAYYFKSHGLSSKVVVLDTNEEVLSKKALFLAAWSGPYAGIVDYRPNSTLVDVDLATLTAKLDFDDVRADVLNVIPPQRAASIATTSGLATANGAFCEVDFLTYESVAAPNVHVLGDAIQVAPLMPKSGHMANQQAKVCASALVALLTRRGAVNPAPIIANTCYSFIDDRQSVHVSSVHRYSASEKTMLVVPGSGGVSSAPSEIEGRYALAWAQNIWADMLR